MKGILLRVGIDSGTGGHHGPIYLDEGKFEYIPIPDDMYNPIRNDNETYELTEGKKLGRLFSEYFPEGAKISKKHIHFDPEFESGSYTYGDNTQKVHSFVHNKPSEKDLHEGDLLVFYAGLQPRINDNFLDNNLKKLYIIGYFTVRRVALRNGSEWKVKSGEELSGNLNEEGDPIEFSYNAHIKIKGQISGVLSEKMKKDMKKPLVIIQGYESGSYLFPNKDIDRPIQISDDGNSDLMPSKIAHDLGIEKRYIRMSTPRLVVRDHIGKLKEMLGISG